MLQVRELELKKHGLKVHLRDPSSYTPIRQDGDHRCGDHHDDYYADHDYQDISSIPEQAQ